MKTIISTVFILFFVSNLYSQSFYIFRNDTINRTNDKNLKYGHWTIFRDNETNFRRYTVDTLFPRILFDGYYKVIDIPNDSISKIEENGGFGLRDGQGDVTLKNGKYIHFSSRYKNKFSVPDGIWVSYNSATTQPNEILTLQYFQDGVLVKLQNFKKGIPDELIIFYSDRMDYFEGSDPKPYKRWLADKIYGGRLTFYPENDISFSNSDLYFYSSIEISSKNDFKLYSNVSFPIKIKSIILSNTEYKIVKRNSNIPLDSLIIPAFDTIELEIIHFPLNVKTNIKKADSLIFMGEDQKVYGTLFLNSTTTHISILNKNVANEFHFKKDTTQSNNLLVGSLNQVTEILIVNEQNKEFVKESLFGIETKSIDMNKLPIGQYYIILKNWNFPKETEVTKYKLYIE